MSNQIDTEDFSLRVDRYWPGDNGSNNLGVNQGSIVPVDQQGPSTPEITFDAEHTVLTPGWFNAHSHLELSGLSHVPFNDDFVDWIYDVLDFKTNREPAAIQSDFLDGCERLLQSGVARVFDHCDRTDLILPELASTSIDAIPLKELIAFKPDQIKQAMDEARDFYRALDEHKARGGLAPHAPYSAHPEIYEQSKDLVDDQGGILSTHLHETRQEMDFVEKSEGRFQDLLEDRTGSRHDTPYDKRPVGELSERGVFDQPALSVHMNYLNEDDYRWLEGSHCYPVFCPRSYSYFGHETAPVTNWVQREIPFCLGTDSTASNEGLNMLDELACLHDIAPGLNPDTILRALTTNPARVMGEPDRGELTYGTPADFSVFEVPSGDLEALTRGDARPLAVFVDGECRWEAGDLNVLSH